MVLEAKVWTQTDTGGRMRLKLLTLAGLCAMLVVLWNQPVRADCTMSGYGTWDSNGGSYDSGCVFEGTWPQPGATCTQWVGGYCVSGAYYYNCNCS
jgi:hypothetical protein